MARKLLIINPENYMEVPFDQQVTIGRDVYNSLSLQDAEISRSHAILFEQGDETIVKDLNSRNGVYVNGDRITEQIIREGDEIILGSTILFLDTPEDFQVERALSHRGERLFERRLARTGGRQVEAVTVFSPEQMDKVIHRLFNEPDTTNFFSLASAMSLMRAYHDMAHARDARELFTLTLQRALEMLGGDHAVIMESDLAREKLKVRSILAAGGEASTIEIGQQVLRVVLRAGRCVFCPNIKLDSRFSKVGDGGSRPVHSFLAAPVMFGEDYYGFIYLESEQPGFEYNFVQLRSLYLLSANLGSLLHPRETHFVHTLETGGSEAAVR